MRNVNRASKSIIFSGLLCAIGLISGCGGGKIGGPVAAEYVYVATGTGVAQFSVTTSGQLTPLTPPEVVAAPAPFNTVWVTVSKDAKYVYAANQTQGTISQFSIGASGAITALTPATVNAGAAPVSVEVTPDAKYVYCLNQTDNTIQQYSVGVSGALTVLAPPTVPVAAGGNTLTISPNGLYLYACSPSSNTISAYTIGSNGQLTPQTVPTYTLTLATSAAISPDSTHLYCPCSTGTAQYSIGAGGALTPLGTPIAPAGGGGSGFTSFAVSANGKHGYMAEFTNGVLASPIDQYNIGLDGSLTAMSPAFVSAGMNSSWVITEPVGNYVFVSNRFDHTISEFLVAKSGNLGAESPAFVTPTGALQMAIVSR